MIVDEPCGYCGCLSCRCDATNLCLAPGCDNPTKRGICVSCDQWVDDQVAELGDNVEGAVQACGLCHEEGNATCAYCHEHKLDWSL